MAARRYATAYGRGRTKYRAGRSRRSAAKLCAIVLLLGALLSAVSGVLLSASSANTIPLASQAFDAREAWDSAGGPYCSGQGDSPPKTVEAKEVFLVDAESGRTVFERDSDKKIAPASTAKMATALTVTDLLPLDKEVEVGKEIGLINEESSRAWLERGDVLTVRQLLIALMLPSGNDAAYTLAVHAGRAAAGNNDLPMQDAIREFMGCVNAKAIALGAESSHFVVPDGFDAEGQYTTAVDLAILAKACLEDPTLAEIVSTPVSHEQWPSGEEATFRSTNQLIDPDSPYYFPGAMGIKTGSTTLAGACLVSAAEIEGRIYIGVVMGSSDESRFQDAINLYESIPG